MKSLVNRIKNKIMKFTGDVHFHKYPMFIIYKPSIHRIKGNNVRNVLRIMRSGDIALRRFDGYLNTLLTPGYWGHAGMCVENENIVHAVGKGVIIEDMLSFCRADSIVLLGLVDLASGESCKAVNKAYSLIGKEYDFEFDKGDNEYYCTELISECYEKRFDKDFKEMFGKSIITPDAIYKSDQTMPLYEFRGRENIESMGGNKCY